MKYCGCGYGCGCQNSCGYPRMRIRMRSSDTPLMINTMKRELSNINKRLEDEEKIDEISEGIVENTLAEENEKGIDTVN